MGPHTIPVSVCSLCLLFLSVSLSHCADDCCCYGAEQRDDKVLQEEQELDEAKARLDKSLTVSV